MGSAALEIIRAAGLSIVLTTPSSLKVGPAQRLTPELRELIRSHKTSLLDELQPPWPVAPHDTRVTCTDCRHLRPGNRCANHRRADLQTRELGSDFAPMRQHCPGFAHIEARPTSCPPVKGTSRTFLGAVDSDPGGRPVSPQGESEINAGER